MFNSPALSFIGARSSINFGLLIRVLYRRGLCLRYMLCSLQQELMDIIVFIVGEQQPSNKLCGNRL